jgi:hypothetical protein
MNKQEYDVQLKLKEKILQACRDKVEASAEYKELLRQEKLKEQEKEDNQAEISKLEDSVTSKYLWKEGRAYYSRSDSYGGGISTNIQDEVLEAIKSVLPISKLLADQVSEIVNKLIEIDMKTIQPQLDRLHRIENTLDEEYWAFDRKERTLINTDPDVQKAQAELKALQDTIQAETDKRLAPLANERDRARASYKNKIPAIYKLLHEKPTEKKGVKK